MTATANDPIAAGNAALKNAAWEDARACFEEALSAGGGAEAWEGLSRAVWWLGDEEQTLSARERAYRAYQEAGDPCGAARMAMWLGSDHLDFRGDDAIACAWLQRGRDVLRDHGPCAELGYITLVEADVAQLAGSDPATAERKAREALALARDIGDVGVEVVALAVLGSALVALGSPDEGLERLEQGAALAVGAEFEEIAAPGWALCHTVSACADVGDLQRAAQWCRALHTWSAVWQARHFFGICRTAYGDVLATSGDWSSAEQELQTALEDMRTTRSALAAPTAVRLGRLRMRQGDAVEARVLFEAALPLPHAVLGLGELALADGDAAAAQDAAERALRRFGNASVVERFPALELLARALAAAHDTAGARETTAELERSAALLATPYMRGRARLVVAHVLVAAGDHDAARTAAEDASDLFCECAAPYERAEARLVLSRALAGLGRTERAEAEARAARDGLAELGARRTEGRADAAELSPRELDILRLVAQGLGDAQIAERLFLSPHTVHRHIANIRAKLRVPSRAAAVGHATRVGLL